MSVRVLDQIRQINMLLHNSVGHQISLQELIVGLGKVLSSNAVLVDLNHKILGICEQEGIPSIGYDRNPEFKQNFSLSFEQLLGEQYDQELNERFLSVLSTRENVELDEYENRDNMILPVDITGERFGTVFVYRINKSYDVDDIIVGEYVTHLIAIELLHDTFANEQEKNRLKQDAKTAVLGLSFQELNAMHYVFLELNKTKGILITSHVAQKYSVTRTIIVNAVKKLSGAGVITSQSMGVKGTKIQIKNPYIEEITDRTWEMRNN